MEFIMKPTRTFKLGPLAPLLCALLLGAAGTQAAPALLESRQVLSFDLDSVRHVESGPLFSFPPVPYLQSQSLQFAGFDAALGTLKDAYLSYQGTYGFEYVVKAGLREMHWGEGSVGQTVAALADFSYALGLSASGVGAPLVAALHGERVTTYVMGYAFSDSYGTMYYFDLDGSGPKSPSTHFFDVDGKYMFQPWITAGDLDTPLLDLADGLDVLGPSVDVTLEKEITQFIMPIFSSSIDPAYSSLDNYLNKWSGSVALTYVYEAAGPAPMPEPGTLLIVGVGMLALAPRRTGRAPSALDRPAAGRS
jgi:hypothetical protein